MTKEEALKTWLPAIRSNIDDFSECQALDMATEALDALDKIRSEIEQLPTNSRTNWDGCLPDIEHPEIEYVDVTKKQLLEIIDRYMPKSEDR